MNKLVNKLENDKDNKNVKIAIVGMVEQLKQQYFA